MSWIVAWPAVSAAFFASVVEVVEAFTIVLAVGTLLGWTPAFLRTFGGLVLLISAVVVLGPLLDRIPIHTLQFVVGVLLLLFGMRWLRKAILRAAGIIPLHDEQAVFAEETAQLQERMRGHGRRLDWIAALTALKAIVLEGLEVIFIVIAIGAGGQSLLWSASLGALAAAALVAVVGVIAHRPLSRIPENILKFGVGVMLPTFGVYWTGKGLGISWPGDDLAILLFAVIFLATGLSTIVALRHPIQDATS
jgi:uncharacterized membrane protein